MPSRNFEEIDISHTPIPEDAEIVLNFAELTALKAKIDGRTAELKNVSREFGNTLSDGQRVRLNTSIKRNGFASQRVQRALPAARKRDKPTPTTRPDKYARQASYPQLAPEELDSCIFAIAICHRFMECHPELYGEIKADLYGREISFPRKLVENFQEDEKDLHGLIASLQWVRGRR